MNIQEVISNFKGRKVDGHCPWDIKALRTECLHFWEDGKGEITSSKICGENNHCSSCKDMNSKAFISVNAIIEKSGDFTKSNYRRK
jgi:hypothetical protein